jgi:hypothetical protein
LAEGTCLRLHGHWDQLWFKTGYENRMLECKVMWVIGSLNQVVHAMQDYNLHTLGLNDARQTLLGEHWTQAGQMLLYAGRDDGTA